MSKSFSSHLVSTNRPSESSSHLSSDVADVIAYLRSPEAIRDRSQQLFNLACSDRLSHFRCHLDALDRAADLVIEVIEANYPDLKIPIHSRWRHFESGDRTQLDAFESQLTQIDALEAARIRCDLTIVSVLLDAGAGNQWQYTDPVTHRTLQRSEGLAIASLHMFCQGTFSSQSDYPLRVDADGLRSLSLSDLANCFQVSERNPLVGLEGRLQLLHRLGQTLDQRPDLFGTEPARPGNLVDSWRSHAINHQLPARQILITLLDGLSTIWTGGSRLSNISLGDVWPHSALPNEELGNNLVPFHKLSQWLTYSLLEPLQTAGLTITQLDGLTGLPEYRNGGLCIDTGLLQLKDPDAAQQAYPPRAELIVEWRSLTVILLDQIAQAVRQKLNMTAEELPLANILEGGTWSAGRQIAAMRRPQGIPPIQLESDGTVF